MPERPRVPDGAGIPEPITAEERAATASYLTYLGELADWGQRLHDRLTDAQKGC